MNQAVEILKNLEIAELEFISFISMFLLNIPGTIGLIIVVYCIIKDGKRRRQRRKRLRESYAKIGQKENRIDSSGADIIIEELDEIEEKAKHENPLVTKEEYERIISSKTGIFTIDTMGGEKFEYFLRRYFQNEYVVETTSLFADYGADLILKKNGQVMAVVQAKRHLSKITISAVYEVLGGMTYYGAKKGIIVTNNDFTQNAINLAEKGNIELWNRDTLIERITRDDLVLIKKGNDEFKDNAYLRTCPVCNEGILWKKKNYNTGKKFYGCSRYKEYGCKFTDGMDKATVKLFLKYDKKKVQCSICGEYMKIIWWKGGKLAVCSSGQYHDKKRVWFPDNKY